MLELIDLDVRFNGLRALDGLSLTVNRGEVLGMIGPNGSGKTTAFNVITGTVKSDGGKVIFDDDDITGLRPHHVARRGIARTFQVVKPFPHLTALENVLAGRLFGGEGSRRTEQAVADARESLRRVDLHGKADVQAESFTILERKWLEVGRALAARPKLILLDEFMAGISAREIPHAVDLVRSINASGVTVILVEHIIRAITEACDRVVVLDAGKKLAEGTVGEVIKNPAVITAYLGTRSAEG